MQKSHSWEAKCWELPSNLIQMAINKGFVINMLMFVRLCVHSVPIGDLPLLCI